MSRVAGSAARFRGALVAGSPFEASTLISVLRGSVPAVVLILLAGIADEAAAHYLGLTDSSIEVAQSGVRIVQTLPNAELAELGEPVVTGTNEYRQAYLSRVAAGWRVASDDSACELDAASVRELDALAALQFDLRFLCDKVVATLEVEYLLVSGFEPTHVNLARVFVGRQQLAWRFTRDRPKLRLPLATILARTGSTLPSAFRADDPNANLPAASTGETPDRSREPAANRFEWTDLGAAAAIYLPSGIEHIVFGPDHVAFVLALVLVPLTLGRLLLSITLFTLAHSVTLGLSYFQVLTVSPAITEPLIALSVAAVGIENLVAHRWAVALRAREATVFLFGLVHGIGLSYQLGELPSQSALDAAARLLMFNIGVEIGQLAILFFPGLLLIWAVRQRFGAWVTGIGSSALVVLGSYWLLARTVL